MKQRKRTQKKEKNAKKKDFPKWIEVQPENKRNFFLWGGGNATEGLTQLSRCPQRECQTREYSECQ